MEAAQAITGWAREGLQPFLNGAIVESPISVGPVYSDRSAEERFESEAMPHLNDLFRTALRMTGERGQAEDVIQEVYLQAWRSFENFEAGTNCRAGLYKILFHCVSHHRRKWFRFPLLKEKEEFLEANLVQPDSVSEHVTDSEILKALDEIPAEFRSVVLLADVEEFAYKEVAEILSIPIGTVMSRLSRGRALLRKRLVQVAWQKTAPATQNAMVREIRQALITLPFYTVFDNLDFRINGGTVTLLGQVTRPLLRDDAEKAVQDVEGVYRVVNQIEVLPVSATDEKLRLAEYLAVCGGGVPDYQQRAVPPIHIIVKGGNVTLEGIVASEMEKTQFFTQASTVPRVSSLVNHLNVVP